MDKTYHHFKYSEDLAKAINTTICEDPSYPAIISYQPAEDTGKEYTPKYMITADVIEEEDETQSLLMWILELSKSGNFTKTKEVISKKVSFPVRIEDAEVIINAAAEVISPESAKSLHLTSLANDPLKRTLYRYLITGTPGSGVIVSKG